MTTVRQIERLYDAKSYDKLTQQLLANRPEAALEPALAGSIPAAALAIVRLDELTQFHVPLYQRLVRHLLVTQEADGGWVDPATTALALRALLCSNGHGAAIERGFAYLARLQKEEGIWPEAPIRRLEADARTSVFILDQLVPQPAFLQAVRFDQAVNWFESHESTLDPAAHAAWRRISSRCQTTTPRHPTPLWDYATMS